MKKILHIRWGEKIGGVETLLKGVAEYSDRGLYESIFCFLKGGESHQKFIEKKNRRVITIAAKNGYDLFVRIRLFFIIRKLSPDIIVEHGVPPLIRPIIKIACRCPLISYDHGCYELYKFKGKNFSNWLIKYEYLTCSNFIITNSLYNKKTINKEYKIPNNLIYVIYPGIDLKIFDCKINERSQFDVLKLAFVGRIQYYDKGADFLIEICQGLLRLNFSNFIIEVFGSGPDEGRLIGEIKNLNLTNFFHFNGETTDVSKSLNDVDVVMVTSRSEAFGLSALEGLAKGCRVVCFDIGGLSESVGECENAILIPPFNIGLMAKAITNIAEEDFYGNKEMAHNYVKNNFPIRNFVSKLDEFASSKINL